MTRCGAFVAFLGLSLSIFSSALFAQEAQEGQENESVVPEASRDSQQEQPSSQLAPTTPMPTQDPNSNSKDVSIPADARMRQQMSDQMILSTPTSSERGEEGSLKLNSSPSGRAHLCRANTEWSARKKKCVPFRRQ